jgi:hypothetical protein
MDRDYTPKQFISFFDACDDADGKWIDSSLPNYGLKCHVVAGVNAAAAAYKKVGTLPFQIIPNVT